MTRIPPGDRPLRSLLERLDSKDAPAAWAEFLEAYSPLILQVARLLHNDPDGVADAFLFVCEQLSQKRCRRLRRFQPDGPASFPTWLRAVVRNLCLDWRRKELGRHRVFRSIARLPVLDQEIFRSLHWDGVDQEAAFHALSTRFPGLTRERLAASAEQIRSSLSPRQLRLLAERRHQVRSLDEGSPERPDAPREVAAPGPDPESLVLERERREKLDEALARLAEPDRLLIRLRFEQGLTLAQVARLTGLENAQRVDRRIRKVLADLRSSLERPPGGIEGGSLERLLRSPRPRREKRTWRCPGEDALAAYAEGEVASSERRRIEGHLASCDFCLGQVTFLLRLADTEPEPVPAELLSRAEKLVEAPRRLVPGRRWVLAPAAAALAVLISLGWYERYRPHSPPPAPTVRSAPQRLLGGIEGGSPEATVLPAVLFPQEGQVVTRPELELRWQDVPRSLFYDVRLLSAEGDRVWEARVEATRTRLPEEVRLAEGETYFVSVRAHLPEGRTLRSPVVGFKVGEGP